MVFEERLEALETEFGDRLLPVTAVVAERWGELNAERRLPVVGGLLAATAMVHDLTLVTRDESPLGAGGVSTVNPWT